jgi:hypothetical protein
MPCFSPKLATLSTISSLSLAFCSASGLKQVTQIAEYDYNAPRPCTSVTKKRWLSLLKIRLNCTLTSINNFTGESAKQPTCVGHSGVQPLLFVIEREGLDFSQCKKREFRLKPTLVRCFALRPVKFFMGWSVHKSFKNSFFLLIYIFPFYT